MNLSFSLSTVNHIGIPVSDLDQSVAFYSALTGQEPAFINDMYGEGLSRGVNVPNAKLRFAIVKIDNLALELIEYTQPRGEAFDRSNNDVGTIHIAFTVGDIDAVYERLRDAGIEFHAPPHEFSEADGAPDVIGVKFAYFSDPNGIQLELNQPVDN